MKILNFNTITATALAFSVVLIPSLASAEMLYRQLEVGSRGADVSSLQTFLSEDPAVYPSGLVTGYFGSLTRSGVVRFQAKNGISQVGRVGPQTLAAINAQMGGVSNGSASIQAAPAFTGLTPVSVNGLTGTVSVSTNVPTRAVLYYSTSPIAASENISANPVTVNVTGTAVQANSNLQTSHTISTQNNLMSGTTYYAMIVVTDLNGVVSVINVTPFRTN